VPPRPKPGRKPATDTPPTKRKAQNRAAQRAFRERRAARIGELEEQLDDQKDDHDKTVRDLQDRINHLEIQTQTLQSRCQWLEGLLEKERQGRESRGQAKGWTVSLPHISTIGTGTMSSISMQQTSSAMGRSPRSDSDPRSERSNFAQPGPRPVAQSLSLNHIMSTTNVGEMTDVNCGSCTSAGPCACAEEMFEGPDAGVGCGKCTLGSRCECLEETIAAVTNTTDLKRPRAVSPAPTAPGEKRQRSDAGLVLETDFTAMFSSKNRAPAVSRPAPSNTTHQVLASVEGRDSCGFCKDGTYCVCADTAMTTTSFPRPSAPIVSQQTQTPPPSENDVVPTPMEVTASGAIKLPGLQGLQNARARVPPPQTQSKKSGCGSNGPGTCAQCLSDPISGLFCRSLAANFEKNSGRPSGGCCGNGGPGGCCKSDKSDASKSASSSTPGSSSSMAATTATRPQTGSSLGLSISCADAYKTLSSHRHFNEAADEIGSWLPKLKVAPLQDGRPPVPQTRLAPMEVEAASIMSVLKGFDIRFGRGQ
jgi:hypothetical protein